MFRFVCCAVLLISAGAGDSSAQVDIRVSVGPEIQLHHGYTEYVFKESGVQEINGTNYAYDIRSKLRYPLDVKQVGGRLDVQYLRNGVPEVTFSVRALANIADPISKMTDQDWINDIEFSSTRSRAEMWAVQLGFEVSKRLSGRTWSGLFVTAGYQLQRISQDLIGVDGWQLTPSGNKMHFERTMQAGTYEITYSLPYVGISPRLSAADFLLDLKAALALVMISDQDHHLLRNFSSDAKGSGTGFIGSGRVRFNLAEFRSKGSLHLEAGLDLMILKANTTETRRYYGDDPVSEDFVESEEVIPNRVHEIRSTQYGMSLGIGLTF